MLGLLTLNDHNYPNNHASNHSHILDHSYTKNNTKIRSFRDDSPTTNWGPAACSPTTSFRSRPQHSPHAVRCDLRGLWPESCTTRWSEHVAVSPARCMGMWPKTPRNTVWVLFCGCLPIYFDGRSLMSFHQLCLAEIQVLHLHLLSTCWQHLHFSTEFRWLWDVCPHFPDLQPLGAGIHVRIQCPTAVAGRWTTHGSRSTDGLSAFGEDGVSTLLHIIEIPGTAQIRLKSGRIWG